MKKSIRRAAVWAAMAVAGSGVFSTGCGRGGDMERRSEIYRKRGRDHNHGSRRGGEALRCGNEEDFGY